MSNLKKSTARADALREECLCVKSCEPDCPHSGEWHTHDDEPCPLHPEILVE
jgi:hypothetical protein